MQRPIAFLTLLFVSLAHAEASTTWMGNVQLQVTRATSNACQYDSADYPADRVELGDWARTRATAKNICFDVYVAGVTDQTNEPAQVEGLELHYRMGTTGPFLAIGPEHKPSPTLSKVGRRGNNLQYAINLTWLDPFYPAPLCLVPKGAIDEDNGRVTATVEVMITLNGKVLAVAGKDGATASLWKLVYSSSVGPDRIAYYRDVCKYEIR